MLGEEVIVTRRGRDRERGAPQVPRHPLRVHFWAGGGAAGAVGAGLDNIAGSGQLPSYGGQLGAGASDEG